MLYQYVRDYCMKLWVYARLMSLLMLDDIIYTDLSPTTVTIVSVAIYSAMLKHFARFQDL